MEIEKKDLSKEDKLKYIHEKKWRLMKEYIYLFDEMINDITYKTNYHKDKLDENKIFDEYIEILKKNTNEMQKIYETTINICKPIYDIPIINKCIENLNKAIKDCQDSMK